MNAADKAIDEIREVRHRISAEFDHDITKYLAHLLGEEKRYQEQILRGKELMAQRKSERQKHHEKPEDSMALRDKPKI